MTHYLIDYLDKKGTLHTNYVDAYNTIDAKRKAYEFFDTITIVNITEVYETN